MVDLDRFGNVANPNRCSIIRVNDHVFDLFDGVDPSYTTDKTRLPSRSDDTSPYILVVCFQSFEDFRKSDVVF